MPGSHSIPQLHACGHRSCPTSHDFMLNRRALRIVCLSSILGIVSRPAEAQIASVPTSPFSYLFAAHAGSVEGEFGGLLTAGARLRASRLRLDVLPADVAVLGGSVETGYVTDANGSCHGPDGRFVAKSNCTATPEFHYGLATEASFDVGHDGFPVTIGGGYRKGDQKSGGYATLSSALTRETADRLAVTARGGKDLYTIGLVLAIGR